MIMKVSFLRLYFTFKIMLEKRNDNIAFKFLYANELSAYTDILHSMWGAKSTIEFNLRSPSIAVLVCNSLNASTACNGDKTRLVTNIKSHNRHRNFNKSTSSKPQEWEVHSIKQLHQTSRGSKKERQAG